MTTVTSTSTALASASSLNQSRCRYVLGGITEDDTWRLGWWERTIIPFRSDDTLLTLTSSRYVGRADLIAYDYLGSEDYEWLILQYNTILDPKKEIVLGAQLRIPLLSRIT